MFNDWHYVLCRTGTPASKTSPKGGRAREIRAVTGQPSLRARIARRLFALAVAAESEETWRLVWERLEARGRL